MAHNVTEFVHPLNMIFRKKGYKAGSARFSHCKVTLFPFKMINSFVGRHFEAIERACSSSDAHPLVLASLASVGSFLNQLLL